jgi:hypothetical protein
MATFLNDLTEMGMQIADKIGFDEFKLKMKETLHFANEMAMEY